MHTFHFPPPENWGGGASATALRTASIVILTLAGHALRNARPGAQKCMTIAGTRRASHSIGRRNAASHGPIKRSQPTTAHRCVAKTRGSDFDFVARAVVSRLRDTPMKLPGSERALVDAVKVRDYLLSHEHPVGRFKAVFFETLGYSRAGWFRLQRDLLDLSRKGTAAESQSSQFGRKYEVRGTIQGPSGRSAEVVTVWVILVGDDVPRFVTAFPG